MYQKEVKEKELIVAIELGSSAIRGIAGSRLPDGNVKVERITQVKAADCIHRGVVYNIEKTTNAIRQIREDLERDLQVQIFKAYVGVQGQSMRTIKNFVRNDFETEREVTDADVDDLYERNQTTNYGELEILEVIPQEYKLDHKEDDEPTGVETRTIEGRFNNVVVRRRVKDNILKCLENARLECADLIISPLALADRVLTEQERRSGCALVDLGAQTTTVQVYKGGKLRYLATIPIGSASITHDIASAGDIELDEAEKLKLAHGIAVIDLTKEVSKAELPIAGCDRTYPLSRIEEMCEARTEEILRNVNECIHRSDISEQITSGISFCGGGSLMKDFDEAYKKWFPAFTKLHHTRPQLTSDELAHLGIGLQGGNFDTLIALLAKAEEVCTREIPKEEPEQPLDLFEAAEKAEQEAKNPPKDDDDDDDDEKKPKGPGFMDRFKKKMGGLWGSVVDSLNE